METKVCSKCKQEKSVHLFYRKRGDSYQSWCTGCMKENGRKNKEYHRSHNLNQKFCMTIAEYELILKSQNGVCKICYKGFQYNLSVDHDHATGKVRGLLCKNCNTMLGNAKDSIQILQSAITYLKGAK